MALTLNLKMFVRYWTRSGKWQGRLDSNQRMAGSKPAALPLGDAPVSVAMSAWHSFIDSCSLRMLPIALNL
jgi:hypothetical protein